MASSSGTASLAIMKTLIATKKSIDEMDRNAYKPRKMKTPATGTVEYKSCGLEGFVPTATHIASGLCEIGPYVGKLTDSGSSIMDHLVKHNDEGHPVAKTPRTYSHGLVS